MDLAQTCDGLVSRFYDCVAGTEPAEGILSDIAETLGYEIGSLVSVKHGRHGDESYCAFASGIDLDTCRRAERAFNMSASAMLTDGREMAQGLLHDRDTLFSMERLRQEAFYEEFSLPNRATEGGKILLYRAPERSVFLNLVRPAPGFDPRQRDTALKILAPHMIRSTLLQVKLDGASALRQLCWETANLCPYPMVIFDNDGALLLANNIAEKHLVGDGLTLTAAGLQAVTRLEHRLLQFCIRKVIACSEGALPMPRNNEVLVSRPSGKRPYRLVVVPLMAGREHMGRRPAAAVLVFDPDDERSISIARCRELFGLTRSEAEVALGVMRGQSAEQIGAISGRSAATVRNLLKRVFLKTGVNRQNELTRLMLLSPLLSFNVPRAPDVPWDPFRSTDTT